MHLLLKDPIFSLLKPRPSRFANTNNFELLSSKTDRLHIADVQMLSHVVPIHVIRCPKAYYTHGSYYPRNELLNSVYRTSPVFLSTIATAFFALPSTTLLMIQRYIQTPVCLRFTSIIGFIDAVCLKWLKNPKSEVIGAGWPFLWYMGPSLQSHFGLGQGINI